MILRKTSKQPSTLLARAASKARAFAVLLSFGLGGIAYAQPKDVDTSTPIREPDAEQLQQLGVERPVGEAGETINRKKIPEESFEDPFLEALRLLNSKLGEKRKIVFGAHRGHKRHGGIDLMASIGTPIHVPADVVVLIGVTRKDGGGPGETIGNGLVFFVPDDERPYFLLLAHLDQKTFELLDESKIGTEIIRAGETVPIVAYTGNTMSGPHPHLHITTTTRFKYGKKTYSAQRFMQLYKKGRLQELLNGENFKAIKPPDRERDLMSLKDYLNPMKLIAEGKLVVTSRPLNDEEAMELADEIIEKTTPEIDAEWEIAKKEFLEALRETGVRKSLPLATVRKIKPEKPPQKPPKPYEFKPEDFAW